MPIKKRKFNIKKLPLKKIVYLVLKLLVVGVILMAFLFVYYSKQIPDPSVISARRISESTKIYDKTGGTILYDIHGEEKRTIIPWDEIPKSIKDATLASEDADFYKHKGFDWRGILRALYKDITTFNASQGGSTITQQLIKKTLLSDEKTLSRKIKEVFLSIQVERKFTKDEIFWMYLNQIPYGSNAYGVEAASQTYFGKKTKDLTIAESALIASLPKAPSYYSPYGNHVDELMSRRDINLRRMRSLNLISDSELGQALKEKPNFKKVQDSILAPHFVIMVREYLITKYGEDMIENGGLQVITTLDIDLERKAEDVVSKYGEINTRYKASNAALTAIDPKTGHILAMVGSKDYFDVEHEGNFNVALGFRQPGSSFKPIAYAQALRKGFTDSTILFDTKTEFNPLCDSSGNQVKDPVGEDCYNPGNYDGQFRGPVTMRRALANSLNIPSVKVLYLAGIDDTIDLAHNLGITTLNDRSRLGLSLVLGGGEVRLVDMVSAYGVFANDGVRNDSNFILKITTGDGKVLEEYKTNENRALEPQTARAISDMLSDNTARSEVFGPNNSLNFPGRQVAAKTGTTQLNRDAWVLGYTPSITVGVWVGNNDNSSMTAAGAGISAAGPMWHEFMDFATRNNPADEFVKPDPDPVDKIMLNGNYLGENNEVHSILYWIDKNNPRGDAPSNPGFDSQYNNWEEAVQRWLTGGF